MNTKTKAQRTNKRQDAIWDKAKALATANAEAKSWNGKGFTKMPSAADKSAHTPGPWRWSWESNDHQWAIITNSASSIIANVNTETGPDATSAPSTRKMPCEANARLIAAAPDLLKVCKLMIARLKGDIAIKAFDAIRQGGMLPSLYAEAETAIQKAEGSAQ